MWVIPKRANFECRSGDEIPDKSIQKFGNEFEAKGNFTFSWEHAVRSYDQQYLCGPYFLIIKEFTRRMQYNAIPLYVEQTQSSKLDLATIDTGMFIEKVIEKELDIFLNFGGITNMMSQLGKVSVPGTHYEPLMTILGSKYPNNEKDHYNALLGIFDTKTWLLMFMSALTLTLIISLLKSIDRKNIESANWLGEIWNIFRIICLKNFKLKIAKKSYYLPYCLVYLSSIFLLNCFSSLILSRTIRKDFTIIGDLNELLARDDIKPYIIFSKGEIEDGLRFGSETVKSILKKSIANNAVKIDLNFIDLAMIAPEMRFLLKTHCILSSAYVNQLFKGEDNDIYFGKEEYFNVILSLFYGKGTNQLLFDTMERLIYDITESGLRYKWMTEALDFGWKVLAEKQVVVESDIEFEFTLSNFKIASGPLFFGYIFAVIVFVLEKVKSIL